MYCQANRIVANGRMPWGAMKSFIADNIAWTSRYNSHKPYYIRRWYDTWRNSGSAVVMDTAVLMDTAVAGEAVVLAPKGRSMLKSRAPVETKCRKRAPGAGRQVKAHCVRQELYEWFVGIRYAIDWTQLLEENRSRGKKTLGTIPHGNLEAQSAETTARL
jgi:hypothetical protein